MAKKQKEPKAKKVKEPKVPKTPKTPKKPKKSGDGKSVKSGIMLFSIRNKIIACFVIPVIFMIIIGLSAYSKAEDGMSDSFLDATSQTVQMASEYIEMVCEFINSEGINFAADSNLQQYYMGLVTDSVEKLNIQMNTKNEMVSGLVANDFIYATHIIPKSKFDCLSTKAAKTMKGMLDDYLEALNVERKDIPKWIDNHEFMDEAASTKLDEYILVNHTLSQNGLYLVVIDMKSSAIKSFLSGLSLGEGSIVGFVTEGGREIICTEETVPQEGTVFYDSAFFDDVRNNVSKQGAEQVKYNGKDYYFVYSKSNLTYATVCALIPVKTVISQAQEIKTLTVLLVIIAVAIALVIGLGTVAGIQGNMKRISRKLEEVSKGDLTVSVNAKGHDEFRYLAGSATHMVSNTKNLVNKVNNATDELAVSAGRVAEASGVIDEYSRNITDAIGEINHGMERQSRHAQECVDKTDILSNEIKQINSMVGQVEKLVDDTESMIARGIEIVKLLGNRAQETTEITEQVGNSIEVLRRESEVINTFVATISDISEQTNLLSLNASIEAARAGESGRGFAVVAEEIRKLADDSAKAAGEIGHNVENITSQTQNSVESAKQAQEMVALQSEAVEQVIDVFKTMQDSMKQLVVGLKDIVEGIERADADRSDAVKAVKNISDIIEETTGSAEAVSDVAGKLLKNVEVLNATAGELGENMDGLKSEISVFKV